MMTLYHCPDCDRIHDEPFEAAWTLLANCIDCALDARLRADPRYTPLPAAAAA